MVNKQKLNKTQIYQVDGVHCSSCEILVEKKLSKQPEVKKVEASSRDHQVKVEYVGEKIPLEKLNQLFQTEKYTFSDEGSPTLETASSSKFKGILFSLGIAVLIIAGFLLLNQTGLSSLVNVSSQSSIPTFFVFGLMAGVSSCAALVGGIVLSLSQKWQETSSENNQKQKPKILPHLLFNSGRLLSFMLLGGLLGLLGQSLHLSLQLGAILIILISLWMVMTGLQMLGFKAFQRFQLKTPKFIAHYITNENNFQGRIMPFLLGFVTFFLPCGFTFAAQSLALASGSLLQGALIMLFFALGTLPMLLTIGFSSLKLYQTPQLGNKFLKAAGILIIFFAFYNVNSQLNVLGFKSLNDVQILGSQAETPKQNTATELPPIVNGKQILTMKASASGYTPNKLKVKAGIPVQWEITDTGTNGCTSAIIAKELFSGSIALVPGKTSTKEFTIATPGIYKFSCWMGMVTGTIEAVDFSGKSSQDSSQTTNPESTITPPTSNQGCGCGGK